MLLPKLRRCESLSSSSYEERRSLGINSGNFSWSACPLPFWLCWISDFVVLKFLGISHPAIDTRDIASFVPFRKSLGYKCSQVVPLKVLVNKFMGRDIGYGYEHPVSVSSLATSHVIMTRSVR